MPYKDFLENYPLYKSFKVIVPSSISNIKLPSINLFCENCDSIQTFVYKYKTDRYGDHYVNRGILEKNPLSKQAPEYPQNPSVTTRHQEKY